MCKSGKLVTRNVFLALAGLRARQPLAPHEDSFLRRSASESWRIHEAQFRLTTA
jgi:hypothetical protein